MDQPNTGVFLVTDYVGDTATDFFIATNGEGKITALMILDGHVGIGVSRCRPEDHYNEEVGINLAATRALKNIVEKMEQRWMSRTFTKDEVIARRAERANRKKMRKVG